MDITFHPPRVIRHLVARLVRALRRGRELEGHFLAGHFLVHARERVQLVLGGVPVFFVQENLQQARPIQAVALALPHNLRGVHQILQQRGVHRGQGAASGAGTRETARGNGHDLAVRHDQNILAAEFLFQLAHQTQLDLVELLEQAERHGNNNRGSSLANRDLLSTVDVQILQLSLELGAGGLQVEKRLKK